MWELPRWTAPPRITTESNSEGSASGGSSKENKDNSQIESEKSNSGADAEVKGGSNQKLDSSVPAEPTPVSPLPILSAFTSTPAPTVVTAPA